MNLSLLFLIAITLSFAVVTAINAATNPIRVAIIGDYGRAVTTNPKYDNKTGEERVANMIKQEYPFKNTDGSSVDFIITLGDNNYPNGMWETIDENIGQFYADFIYPYNGNYTRSASAPNHNRWFSCLGNHDEKYNKSMTNDCTTCPEPYLKYFENVIPPAESTSDANGRYYDYVRGPVHFFALNSNWQEPDGITQTGKQAMWLKQQLAKSTSPHRVVYMHHQCYSNDIPDGPTPELRWPFKEWGASIVLSGHAHMYQKFFINGFHYITCGNSGTVPLYPAYPREQWLDGTLAFFNNTWGAMHMTADDYHMNVSFFSIDGTYSDSTLLYPVYGPHKQNDNAGSSSSSSGQLGSGIGIGFAISILIGFIIVVFVKKGNNNNSSCSSSFSSGAGGNNARRSAANVESDYYDPGRA